MQLSKLSRIEVICRWSLLFIVHVILLIGKEPSLTHGVWVSLRFRSTLTSLHSPPYEKSWYQPHMLDHTFFASAGNDSKTSHIARLTHLTRAAFMRSEKELLRLHQSGSKSGSTTINGLYTAKQVISTIRNASR